MTSTSTSTEPTNLSELAAAILRLDLQPPAERAAAARHLGDVARRLLAAAADAAVVDALDGDLRPAQLARQLQVSPAAITKARKAHEARQAAAQTLVVDS